MGGRLRKLSALSLVLVACSFAASATASSEGSRCVLPNNGKIEGAVVLDGSCSYAGKITIAKSNTVLDCAGAIIDGQHKETVGLMIRGKSIENVRVRNCKFYNSKGMGVMISSGIKGADLSSDPDRNFELSPRNIELQGIEVKNVGKNGVHFNAYVRASKIEGSLIEGSGKVGIYLGQSTQDISLIGNRIYANGKPEKGGPGREGVAIDSSARNIIRGNEFKGNSAGAIFLYKNCGESRSGERSISRWQSSNDNQIEGNYFSQEKIGVWIASRQSRDLKRWGCSDPSVDSAGKYYKDYANNNVVKHNTFCSTAMPIKVEGDGNTIDDNAFDRITDTRVVEPYKNLTKPDGSRSVGNVVENNKRAICR